MEVALLYQGSRSKQEEGDGKKRENKWSDEVLIENNDDSEGELSISHPKGTVVWFSHSGNRRRGRKEEAEKKSNDDTKDDSDNADKMCRICYESSENSQIIKLGCDCKGGIGFAHRICASKWFSHKRNKACEICGKNVDDNNNVTITRTMRVVEHLLCLIVTVSFFALCVLSLISG